jgi:hypothetical protein
MSDACFQLCKSLSVVEIEGGSELSVFCPSAFSMCWNLKSVFIPSSIKHLFTEYGRFLKISENDDAETPDAKPSIAVNEE